MKPLLCQVHNSPMKPRVRDCDLPPGLLDEMLPTPVNVRTVCGMIGVKFELP